MTREELVTILEAHLKWLRGDSAGKKADLRGADLRGADLSEADLSEADLSGADLSGADLRGADLSGADLSEADLSEADLSGADLSGADLRGADLSGADLRGALGIPIPDPSLPRRVAEKILGEPCSLKMNSWHCGTAHCLGGWAITLTPNGSFLEDRVGAQVAAHLLMPSASHLFYKTGEEELPEVLKWCEEQVKTEAVASDAGVVTREEWASAQKAENAARIKRLEDELEQLKR